MNTISQCSANTAISARPINTIYVSKPAPNCILLIMPVSVSVNTSSNGIATNRKVKRRYLGRVRTDSMLFIDMYPI